MTSRSYIFLLGHVYIKLFASVDQKKNLKYQIFFFYFRSCSGLGSGRPGIILPWSSSNHMLPVNPSPGFFLMFLLEFNIKQQAYLKVFVDERLPVRLDLTKLWAQSFDLALHPHDVLKVSLCPQVQHLDWLWHVLHLLKRTRWCRIDFPVRQQIKTSLFSPFCCPPCSNFPRNESTLWPPTWLSFNKPAGCRNFKSILHACLVVDISSC